MGPAGREGEVAPPDRRNQERRGRRWAWPWPWLASPGGRGTPPVQLSSGFCRGLRNPWPRWLFLFLPREAREPEKVRKKRNPKRKYFSRSPVPQ